MLRRSQYKYIGQISAEYVIVFAIIMGALILLTTYMKRGIQGVIKVAADEVGRQDDFWEDKERGTTTTATSASLVDNSERLREFTGGSGRRDVDYFTGSAADSVSFKYEDKED